MTDCQHIYYLYRGRRLAACDCVCRNCHNALECICTECSHDPEVHIEPNYYNRIQAEDSKQNDPPPRACKECGVEVVRKNNRGRWPLRCQDCR